MKEFDKIYLAKYKDVLNIRQLAEDLKANQEEINESLNELKKNKMLDIYKNISDWEWEKLEKLSDDEIRFKYYRNNKELEKKAIIEMFEIFKIKSVKEELMNFTKFNYEKIYFDRDYMEEEDYENEEWKKIGNLNYEVSNYGRIKNTKTKKLKKLKHQVYGMQVLLWQNSKSYTITISRLVAEMFIRHLEKNERAMHIDGNAKNNYYKNLRIVSK